MGKTQREASLSALLGTIALIRRGNSDVLAIFLIISVFTVHSFTVHHSLFSLPRILSSQSAYISPSGNHSKSEKY